MAPTKCKTPSAPKVSAADIAAIKEDSLKKKDEDARKAAAEKITEIVNAATCAEEPMLIDLLEIAITLAGDNKSKNVREAADVACAAFPAKLSEFAVRACLGPIFTGFNSQFWQSKMRALELVDSFVARNPKAVAACLPEIIPELAQVMVDMRDEVKEKSTDTMAKVGTCVGNIDIDPFIPTLIECIHKVDEVPSACTSSLPPPSSSRSRRPPSPSWVPSSSAVSSSSRRPPSSASLPSSSTTCASSSRTPWTLRPSSPSSFPSSSALWTRLPTPSAARCAPARTDPPHRRR